MKNYFFSIIAFLLFNLLGKQIALAADPALTYHGRLLTSAGIPVSGSVNFKIQIRSPGVEDCLLWEETQSQTLDAGVFVLALNGSSSTRTDGNAHSFTDVFSNRQTFNVGAAKCAAGYSSFNPSTADARVLKVSFNDGTFSGWEDAPNQAINYVPKAIDALRVSGVPIESLLRFSENDGTLINTSPLNNAQYTELLALLAGTSDKYLKSSATEGVTLPVLASQPTLAAGKLWYESGTIKYYDASSAQVKTLGTSSAAGTVTNIATGTGLTGGPITATGTISLASGVATPGTYQSVTVDTYGRVTSGTNPTTVTDYGIIDAVKNGGQTGAVTVGSSDANAVSIMTNNTSKMTVLSNGNVGIGTESPSEKLGVSGGNIIVKYNSTKPFQWQYDDNQPVWSLGGGNYFNLSQGNNVFLKVDGTGKVGIGTTAPAGIIDVRGGTASAATNGTHINLLAQNAGTGNQNGGNIILTPGTATGTGTAGSVVASSFYLYGNEINTWNGTPVIINARRMIDLSPATVPSTIINPTVGSVGIGTSSPVTKLNVAGSSGAAIGDIFTISGTGNAGVGRGPGLLFQVPNAGAAANGGRIAVAESGISTADTYMSFYTNTSGSTTEKVRIDNLGNVGIGTTTPRSPLEITGALQLTKSGNTGWTTTLTSDTNGDLVVSKNIHLGTGQTIYNGASAATYYSLNGYRHTAQTWFTTNTNQSGFSYQMNTDWTPDLPGYTSSISSISGGINSAAAATFIGQKIAVNDNSAAITNLITGLLVDVSGGGNIISTRYSAIFNGGNVGIGTSVPSEMLHVVGNLRVQGSNDCTLGNGAGGTNCSSDVRLKDGIEEIDDAFIKILLLRGVEFTWNEKSQSPGHRDIGVIAQDVEKVFPTAVIEDSNTGYKKVDYAVLVAPIIEAFKEIQKRFQRLFDKLDSHSDLIASLKTENSALKFKIEELKLANEQEISSIKTELAEAKTEAKKIKENNEEIETRLNRIEEMLHSE